MASRLPGRRPKLFFDTNVPSKLLEPPYSAHLNEITHEISKRYRIVFSPETLIELMDTLKGGDGSFFELDRQRLRITAGEWISFLPFPGEFALRRALGIERPALFGPNDFKRWYRVIQAAKSRRELFEGGVPRRNQILTFDPRMIETQQRAGKDFYQNWLRKAVTGGYRFPPPERWALRFAKDLGCDISPDQARVLADHLTAVYQFRRSDFETAAANKSYRWDKRDSDWVDGQQLTYLADGEMHMLTDEQKIKKKCRASSQSERIFILSEFVRDQLALQA